MSCHTYAVLIAKNKLNSVLVSSMAHVLVFDSGVGGLSVVADLRALLPDLHINYVADDDFRPYGDKTALQLKRRLPALIQTLVLLTKPDIVVLACTHYPFLTNVFRRLAPWPVDWLDPAEAIAKRAQFLLKALPPQQPDETGGHDRVELTGEVINPALIRLLSGFGLHMASSNN